MVGMAVDMRGGLRTLVTTGRGGGVPSDVSPPSSGRGGGVTCEEDPRSSGRGGSATTETFWLLIVRTDRRVRHYPARSAMLHPELELIADTRIPVIIDKICSNLSSADRALFWLDVHQWTKELEQRMTREEVQGQKRTVLQDFLRCSSFCRQWAKQNPEKKVKKKRTREEQKLERHRTRGNPDELSPCPACGGEMRADGESNDAFALCQSCGMVQEGPRYYQQSMEESTHSRLVYPSQYRPQNHLCEVLSQVQGRILTPMPTQVREVIMRGLKSRRTPTSKCTPQIVRDIVSKSHLPSRWLDYAATFCRNVGGTGFPTLSPELEDHIIRTFMDTLPTLDRVQPTWRKNLLSYAYLVRKILELAGERGVAKHFKLLKNRDKVFAADATWKKVCKAKGWAFIPTTVQE